MFGKKSVRERINDRKAEAKKKALVNFSSFLIDVKHNPMILIGLGGSAIFTVLAGIFIGIAPQRVDNTIVFFGGATAVIPIVIGIFFALLYGVSFPLIGEWGMYYWHKKASLRDEGNKWQAGIGYTMLVLTAVFTGVTAVYASNILASLVSSFTVYRTITPEAQVWTVTIIPVALISHAIANIWYDHVSAAAEERRELERELQRAEMEAEGRIREARVAARERAANAFADEYVSISEREADQVGRTRAKNTWNSDRLDMGADRVVVPEPEHEEEQNFPPGETGRRF